MTALKAAGEFVTLSDVMELLGCSLPKVHRLIAAGDIDAFDTAPSTASRRCIVVTKESVARFKFARKVSGTGVDTNERTRPVRRKILRKLDARGKFASAAAPRDTEEP